MRLGYHTDIDASCYVQVSWFFYRYCVYFNQTTKGDFRYGETNNGSFRDNCVGAGKNSCDPHGWFTITIKSTKLEAVLTKQNRSVGKYQV